MNKEILEHVELEMELFFTAICKYIKKDLINKFHETYIEFQEEVKGNIDQFMRK